MDVARTPQKVPNAVPEPSKAEEKIFELLERGMTVNEIANKLGKGDKAKVGRFRRKIWRLARRDEQFQRNIVERTRANLIMGLPTAGAGQIRSARRAKTPAAKLVMEATGFHNPRVKHDHTGDIKITIDMPRPSFDDDGMGEDS